MSEIIKVIRLGKLNELYEEFKSMKNEFETFEEFVYCSNNWEVMDWEIVEEKHLKSYSKIDFDND
jgi:hypothetical protein